MALEAMPTPLSKLVGGLVFPRLRRLFLAGFWTEPQDVFHFLSRHTTTLENLTLKDLLLGGIREAPASSFSERLRVVPNPKTEPQPLMMSTDWDRIALACQEMPRLNGLLFEEAWSLRQFIGKREMLRVTDLGMKGRTNVYEDELAADRKLCTGGRRRRIDAL